jgi:hypothetical protein
VVELMKESLQEKIDNRCRKLAAQLGDGVEMTPFIDARKPTSDPNPYFKLLHIGNV